MMVRAALANGVPIPPQALRRLSASGESFTVALRGLGLKLEKQKAAQEVLVVDGVRKTPTEN